MSDTCRSCEYACPRGGLDAEGQCRQCRDECTIATRTARLREALRERDSARAQLAKAEGRYCRQCGSPRPGDTCWKCGGETHKPDPHWIPVETPPIEPIREIAKAFGYAIAVHGSQERDLDLIAVPWIENPASAAMLLAGLVVGLPAQITNGEPTEKPLGRVAVTLHLTENAWTKSIDLSIVPLAEISASNAAERDRLRAALTEILADDPGAEGVYTRAREALDA